MYCIFFQKFRNTNEQFWRSKIIIMIMPRPRFFMRQSVFDSIKHQSILGLFTLPLKGFENQFFQQMNIIWQKRIWMTIILSLVKTLISVQKCIWLIKSIINQSIPHLICIPPLNPIFTGYPAIRHHSTWHHWQCHVSSHHLCYAVISTIKLITQNCVFRPIAFM